MLWIGSREVQSPYFMFLNSETERLMLLERVLSLRLILLYRKKRCLWKQKTDWSENASMHNIFFLVIIHPLLTGMTVLLSFISVRRSLIKPYGITPFLKPLLWQWHSNALWNACARAFLHSINCGRSKLLTTKSVSNIEPLLSQPLRVKPRGERR